MLTVGVVVLFGVIEISTHDPAAIARVTVPKAIVVGVVGALAHVVAFVKSTLRAHRL